MSELLAEERSASLQAALARSSGSDLLAQLDRAWLRLALRFAAHAAARLDHRADHADHARLHANESARREREHAWQRRLLQQQR